MQYNDTDLNTYADCPKRTVAKIMQRGLSPFYSLRELRGQSATKVINEAVSAGTEEYLKRVTEMGELFNPGNDEDGEMGEFISIAIKKLDSAIVKKSVNYTNELKDYTTLVKQIRRLTCSRILEIANFSLCDGAEIMQVSKDEEKKVVMHLDYVDDNYAAHIWGVGTRAARLPLPQAGVIFERTNSQKVFYHFQKIVNLKKDLPPVEHIEIPKDAAVMVSSLNASSIQAAFKHPQLALENPSSNMCSEKYCPAYNTDMCFTTGAGSAVLKKIDDNEAF